MPTEQNKILDGLKQQLTTASQTLSSMSAPKISATSLTSPVAPLQIPQYTPPAQTPFVPAPLTQATQTAQADLDASQADLGAIYDKLGTQSQRKQQLETAQGIPAINSRLSELNALDAQYAAELTGITANELKQNVTGDLATNYAPLRNAISAQDTRLNIQKQQSVNIKRATNAAATAAATGQLALAQEYVQKALDAEFEPLKYQLEYKKMIYDRNKDTFNAAEQRQFEAVLKADERKYEEQKTNKEQILNLVATISKYGAPQTAIDAVTSAKDSLSAINLAAPYMQDPAAKLDLEKTRLDMILTKAQIDKVRKETNQIGQKSITETKEEIKAAKEAAAARQSELEKANQALTVIQQLKAGFAPSKTTSGTTLPSAGSRAVGPISSKFPTIKGSTADFERAHDQLKALLSLDNYKLLKGTGQVSNYEGQLLANAATQLDLGMSDTGYTKELEKLDQAFTAIVNKASTLAPDEQAILDAYYSNSSPTQSLPAANYFRP